MGLEFQMATHSVVGSVRSSGWAAVRLWWSSAWLALVCPIQSQHLCLSTKKVKRRNYIRPATQGLHWGSRYGSGWVSRAVGAT